MIGTLSTGHASLLITNHAVSHCVIGAGAIHASLRVDAVGPNVAVLLAAITPRRHPSARSNVNQQSVYSIAFPKEMVGTLGRRTANFEVCRLFFGCSQVGSFTPRSGDNGIGRGSVV